MEFYSFASIRNRFVSEESGQLIYEDGYGLIANGSKSILFRKQISGKLKLNDILKFEKAVMVFNDNPNSVKEMYDKLIGIYHLIHKKDGIFHIHFFKGQKEVIEYLLNEKYKFVSVWTIEEEMNPFWESLGFLNKILRRKVPKANTGKCLNCNFCPGKFLNPEKNALFCSGHCFEKYETELK